MKIAEIQGFPQIFNLADGSVLRLAPRERAEITKKQVSDEIEQGIKMGCIIEIPATVSYKSIDNGGNV